MDRQGRTENILSRKLSAEELLARLADPSPISLTELQAIYTNASVEATPEFYHKLGTRILAIGEPLLAYDVLAEAQAGWPEDVRIRQLLSLALARSGATKRASEILQKLHEEGHSDGETLGILGRTHKSLWEEETSAKEKRKQLEKSHAVYCEAYEIARNTGNLDDAYYTGINAAATALLLGQGDQASDLSKSVTKTANRALQLGGDLYWALATLAEASLIAKDWSKAEDHYRQAAEAAKGRFADLSTTRRQARVLLDHIGQDPGRFDSCFDIPIVVIFAGHMIDKPGRENPRFPAEIEASVRSEIKAKLDTHNAGFGYSSAACGSDILFLELMLERGAEIQVILPFEEVDFLRTSVDLVPGAGWESRFHHVLERAAKIIVVDEATDSSNYSSYEYANLMIEGLGQLRANTLDTDLKPLFVWDGQAGDGPGGTHSQISRLHAKGYEVEVVDIAHLAGAEGTSPAEKIALPRSVQDRSDILDQRIIPMLFADVVGYSRLKERGTVFC
jgi:hypothetical protein